MEESLIDSASVQGGSPPCSVCEASFAKKSILVLKHPPYSPDLVQRHYVLFPEVKSAMHGTIFQSAEQEKQKRQSC